VNVTEPIRRMAVLSPDTPAIIRADGGAISYAALDAGIDRMAGRAAALGLRPGDIAALSITGSHQALRLTLGLALARIGVASADVSLPPALTRVRLRPGPVEAPGVVGFDPSWIARPGPAVEVHRDASAILRVFASSGTTGVPKFVAISHELMARRLLTQVISLGAGPAVRMIGVSLGIIYGFTAVLRTFWFGGTLVLTDTPGASAAITRHEVTSIATSPAGLRALLDAMPLGTSPLPSLRQIEVGGSRVPPALRDAATARLCGNLVSFLGATECGGIAAAPLAALAGRTDAVGYLMPGVEAQAVDADDAPLPAGQQGVLRVRSANLAAGYFGQALSDSFRDGWFYPGDVGTVWPDGMLSLAGRSGDLLNVGGAKLSPQVIEDALLSLPQVTDAAAFSVPDASGLEQVWAAIVTTEPIAPAALNDFCRKALPGKAPRFIIHVKELPRNAMGKVQRDALVALAREQGPAG